MISLEVELWTDNSLPSASVDRIPLGTMCLYGTIWTRYIHKVYRRQKPEEYPQVKVTGVEAVHESCPQRFSRQFVICNV